MAINLNADAVREEIKEAEGHYGTTEKQDATLNSLPDENIEQALMESVDDEFLQAFNEVVSSAVRKLVEERFQS